MAIQARGRTIETDEEGFLVDRTQWNKDVAVGLAHDEQLDMSETHWGLVDYVRQYYAEHQVHPTMHMLVKSLGKVSGTAVEGERAYVNFLYQLFPNDPIRQLCKISGLPKPLPTEHDG
ncbi:MAG: TusE/DsrC/DsvC family sulfur relay protein [Gammaproteobacteria bacterium]